MSKLVSILPKNIQPYARLGRFDRPIGSLLVFWPCAWNLTLFSPLFYPPIIGTGLFFQASIMIRAAGCTINDGWDIEFDKKVERTKNRPLAKGEISEKQALIFFLANISPIPIGMFMIGPVANSILYYSLPLILFYPLAKRVTYWPQLILGVAMSFGGLMASIVLTEAISYSALFMFGGSICWTMIYDSIYAFQDREDDIHAGVKSTALLGGTNYKFGSAGFTLGATTLGGLAAGLENLGLGFYCFEAIGIAGIVKQGIYLKENDPNECGKNFTYNNYIGVILFIGLLLGKYQKEQNRKDTIAED